MIFINRKEIVTLLLVGCFVCFTMMSNPFFDVTTAIAHDFGGPTGPGGDGGGGDGGDGGGGDGGGDPFRLSDGRELMYETDFTLEGLIPIKIGRYYDSMTSYDSPLGYGWSLTFNERLFRAADGAILMRRDNGVRSEFVESGGAYVTPGSERGELIENPDGTFTFTETRDIMTATGYIRQFDVQGRLVEVEDVFGNKLVLTYDAGGKFPLVGRSPFALDPTVSTVVAYDYRLTRIEEFAEDGSATGRWADFLYEGDGARGSGSTRQINLLTNPGAETGDISGWTAAPSFTVRTSSPSPHEGGYYFSPGSGEFHEISQTIDLLSHFTVEQLDSGDLFAHVGGYQISYNQSPTDEGQILVYFQDGAYADLDSFVGPVMNNTSSWELVEDGRYLPVGTRYIKYVFQSTRLTGTANDGYLDSAFVYVETEGLTEGRLVRIADSNGREWSLSHDLFGNLTAVLNPEGETTSYVYADGNDVHNLTEIQGGYQTREITYDDSDRVVQQIIGDLEINVDYTTPLVETTMTELVRDGGGAVITQKVTTYEFNSLGNPIRITYDDGREVQYERNSVGQTTLEEWYESAILEKSIAYSYDSDGLLLSAAETDAASGEVITRNFSYTGEAFSGVTLDSSLYVGKTFEIQYDYTLDAGDNPLYISTKRVLNNPGGVTPQYDETTFTYNTRGQLEVVSMVGDPLTPAVTLSYTDDFVTQIVTSEGSVTYTRDARGNIEQATIGATTLLYEYDSLDRLIGVTLPSGEILAYTWSGPYVTDVTSSESYSLHYVYDSLNRMTTIERTIAPDTVTIMQVDYDKVAGTVTLSDNRSHVWVNSYDQLLLYVTQESVIDSGELPSVIPLEQYNFPLYSEPIHFVVGEILDRYQPIVNLPLK